MPGAFHVPLGRSCARIEILEDQIFRHVRTPFEEPTTNSFEERRNLGTAQGLVGELNGIDSSADGVREGRQCDRHGLSLRRVWGTI